MPLKDMKDREQKEKQEKLKNTNHSFTSIRHPQTRLKDLQQK